jgi:cell division transport system ATP-binding protein
MRAVGKSRTDVRQQVPDILERVNILHRADAYPTELSGGEQQRVAIARALINDPPLLLADEPTGNLDPEHSEEITDLLLSLHARGTTVIVATHDMAVVERVGHRILRMSAGRIDSRTPEEIAADDQADQTVVSEPNDEPAPPSQPSVTDPEEGTDG